MVQINRLKKVDTNPPLSKTPKTISQLLLSQQSNRTRCCYTNYTAQFQIVRIDNAAGDFFFERVVLPHTTLIFEACPEDYLEIHTGNPVSSILSDKIQCHRLTHKKE